MQHEAASCYISSILQLFPISKGDFDGDLRFLWNLETHNSDATRTPVLLISLICENSTLCAWIRRQYVHSFESRFGNDRVDPEHTRWSTKTLSQKHEFIFVSHERTPGVTVGAIKCKHVKHKEPAPQRSDHGLFCHFSSQVLYLVFKQVERIAV